MFDNPFLPSPTQAAAWSEGFVKALAAQSAPSPSQAVGPDDEDAFNQGVQAGVDAQTSGFPPPAACVAAVRNEDGDAPDLAIEGVDFAAHVLFGALKDGLAGALEGAITSVVLFVITAPVQPSPPSSDLSTLGQPLADRLSAIGVGSLELFCGIGIDQSATGCEFKLTPLFLRLDQARAALDAMNRPAWLIGSWRTDQCGSFTVTDSQG